MKLLLDTCCIIWAISDPDSLSKKAAALLQARDSEIFVKYALLTADRKLLDYPHVNTIW